MAYHPSNVSDSFESLVGDESTLSTDDKTRMKDIQDQWDQRENPNGPVTIGSIQHLFADNGCLDLCGQLLEKVDSLLKNQS